MAVAHGSKTLCFARGDLRNTTARIPSRWLLDTARRLSGDYVSSEDLYTRSYDWLSTVASFGYAIAESELLATRRDFRLQRLGDGLAQGAQLADLVTDDLPLKAAVEMQQARWSSSFTRFDGNLSTEQLPEVGTAYAVSPTQLEEWAKCPFGYFMKRFLKIEALTAPEQILQISALDRGSLIHEVLERFIQEAITSGSLPEPAEHWPTDAHERMDSLFAEVAERFASEGRLGNALLWKKEGAKTLRELQQFLLLDNNLRAAGNYRPVSTEASFGFTDTPAVLLTLPNGTDVQFRGSADRIDLSDAGEILIIDYKSGSSSSFKKLSAANPVSSGQKLQLPIYALAAQQLLDAPEAPTTAEYWFVTDQTRKGYTLTEDVLRVFGQTVQTILEGITHGVFPQKPIESGGKYNPCVYCNPDDLGTTRVSAAWERKQHDPAIEIFHALDEIAP